MATLLPSLSSDNEEEVPSNKLDDVNQDSSDDEIDGSFEFGGILGEDGGFLAARSVDGWSYQMALHNLQQQQQNDSSTAVPRMDVAALIAAKRKSVAKREKAAKEQSDETKEDDSDEEEDGSDSESSSSDTSSSSDDDDDDVEDEGPPVDDSHRDLDDDVLRTRAGEDKDDNGGSDDDDDGDTDGSDNEDRKEAVKAAAFFDDEPQQSQEIEVFPQLSLTRPLLRGVAAMGFVKPTPIQAAVIPLALAGRDICASAVTGSGKTAAFLLPILQRLLHRGRRTQAVILTPTRELAAQCLGMMTTLAQYTKLRATLIVGGAKNVNAQAAELRTRPDVIIATPGRLLDHVTNSTGVTLEDAEFLVLDEADRLLDLGFQDEVHELIKACPVERQTMLFSATMNTMNTRVDDLIKLSLKRPVRVRISDKEKNKDIEVAPRLEQEFVRIRAGNEGINREGMLLALLTRTFPKQTIVFFDTKATAHRLMIICGLCGIKCAELHGNLTQQQRLTALEEFRRGDVDILLATDLAARGLDIDQVQTVVNFEMPAQIETYIHRIGRTARAGRGGMSCTLVGEGRRHLMKELIKDAQVKTAKRSNNNSKNAKASFESGVIRSRAIPLAVTAHFVARIKSLETDIEEVLAAEAVARMDRLAEMEAIRAQNIIEHAEEIQARPQREWFASNKQKKLTREAAAEKHRRIAESAGTGTHRMTRKKRRAREALEALNAPDDDDSGQENGPSKPAVNIKSAARKQKRKQEDRERTAADKSIRDEHVEMERSRRAEPEKRRGRPGMDAMGDGSLFDEEKVSFSAKSSSRRQEAATTVKSSFRFRQFDPLKKLGKKKGHKAFKSKSKYKRR